METSPDDVDVDQIFEDLRDIDGVRKVSYIWIAEMNYDESYLLATLKISRPTNKDVDEEIFWVTDSATSLLKFKYPSITDIKIEVIAYKSA